MKLTNSVNIVVAHGLEAKPILSILGLEKLPEDSAYPVFTNDEGVSLVISGMGREAAQQAVNYLAGQEKEQGHDEAGQTSAWLNIGIAGHCSFDVGEGLLINKITEQASGETFYPGTQLSGYKTASLITVDEIERGYQQDAVYEMEASGFYRAAQAFSSSEFIQAYKIISDNRENHVDHIDLKEIPAMIRAREREIVKLVKDLFGLLRQLNSAQGLQHEYYDLKSTFRFSVTQGIQLKRLCQRFNAQGKNQRLEEIASENYRSAKQLIAKMNDALD
jgi:adenosylhomocysteine nucleosidase